MLVAMLRRVWRITVLVVAALCFLLALFLNYDGLGQALGVNAALTGTAGRITLAGIAALLIVVVVARFGREAPPPVALRKGRSGSGKSTAGKKKPARKPAQKGAPATAKPKTASRRTAQDRPAGTRPPARPSTRRR